MSDLVKVAELGHRRHYACIMRFCCLLLSFCLPGALHAAQPAGALTRVAIVAEDAVARPAADLLTVELSRDPGVQLLERGEIDRIYREQRLSAANTDYLKLGQLLGAEGLLLLDALQEGTNHFLELKFVAVKPGVVLSRERFKLSMTSAPDWGAGLARHLAPLIRKASVLVKDAVPLSIVGLRAGVQSAEGRELERQMTLLLIERLSRQREVFVLERRKLDLLAGEKELKGMDESAFWNGSFLVEGTLDREGYSPQSLTINARLVPPHGGAPQALDVTCNRTNLAAGIEELAAKVLAALKLQPSPAAWNSAAEAEQFFTNSAWAYRWGLLGQAQAASEAAWALGNHSEPLARLRARAYADDVWPIHEWSGNIEIPGLPDPAKLKPLLRGLELFCHDAPLVSTNAGRLDEQWYLNGLRLFRESAAMLDGFYHWAELTAANQEQVAETRLWTRQLLALLETNAPMDRAGVQARFLRGGPGSATLVQELKMVDLVKWNQGGLLFDRPEESLPMFRTMLAKGYAPSNLPRLVGWTWEQRKTVPGIMHQFIDELCASTNPPVRLAGLTIALTKTPFYPESDFHAKESALVGAIWELRSWVIISAEHAAVLERAEQVLRDKYGDFDVNAHFAREPFAGTRFRIEKEFLLSATNFDNQRFQAIFPLAYYRMPPADARELAIAMERLSKDRFAAAIRDRLRALGGLSVPTNATPAAPALPAEEPLMARFVPWKTPSQPSDPEQRLYFERLISRNGRLWSLVAFLGLYERSFAFHPPTLCISVDPQSGTCEEIHFPQNIGRPNDSIEVTDGALYVSVQDHLARYRFATRTWDTLPVPLEGGAALTALGEHLYLANADTVLQLDPESLTSKVLASARRQPAANELDTLLNSSIHLYARTDGKLGIMASDHFLVFAPATGKLTETSAIPAALLRGFRTPFFSPAGVLLRTDDGITRRQLAAFWNDQPGMELLLQQFHAAPGFGRRQAPTNAPAANARWEWPETFDLETACILAQGTNLWVLSPRKVWSGMGVRFEEPVNFADARQATLFWFQANAPRAVSIPVAFAKTDIEPFDPFHGGYSFLAMAPGRSSELPFWLDTPNGLVLSAPTLRGHWLIPRGMLDSHLAALRAKGQTQSASRPTS